MSVRTIKDNQGREWRLQVTFPVLRTMRDEGIIDLLAERDPLKAIPLFLDAEIPTQLDAIDCAIQQTENQAQKFESYDFANAQDEETIWQGVIAFSESLADFYPSRSALIQKVLSKARQKMEQSTDSVREAIQSGKFDSLIAKTMDSEPLGSGSTSLPDLSESPA